MPSHTGTRFGLDEREFDAWWRHLPTDDYEAFLFYGGDEVLMRFVCAYDFLSKDDTRATPGRIIDAYAIAVNLPATQSDVPIRAGKAYTHPAVRDLLDRLSHRDLYRARTRLARRYVDLLETLATEAGSPGGMKDSDRISVAVAMNKYLSVMQTEERDLRANRLREAKVLAGKADPRGTSGEVPNENELGQFITMLKNQFGHEKILALVGEMYEPRTATGTD